MRIVSDFKDYYDCCQDYSDKSLQYIRQTKLYDIGVAPYVENNYNHIGYGRIVIGFAGKIYRCICYKNEYFFNIDKAAAYFQNVLTDDVLKSKRYRPLSYWLNKDLGENDECRRYYEKFFDEYNTSIFAVYNSCSFDIGFKSYYKVEVNCRLNLYKFQSVLNPQQAYQELYFHYSNKARPEPFIPPISNRDMLESKGFDNKYSFRKEKTKR